MTKLKKWQLIKTEDVSPSKYFPVEKRRYKLPNGKTVDDFYVTTIADSVHVVPVTKEGKVVMIRIYKQGVDKVVTQFPAGRFESAKHSDIIDVAVQELEEEAGIKVSADQLEYVGKHALMTTKATEYAHLYLVKDVEFNGQQNLDENEEIEVITLNPKEVDELIVKGEIIGSPTIANWYLIKKKYFKL